MKPYALLAIAAWCLLAAGGPAGVSAASLREAAAACGITYGSAVGSAYPGDAAYTDLIAQQCNIIVAENCMKFDALQPQQNQFSWGGADALMAFAQQNDLQVQGTTLIWYFQVPSWLSGGSFNRQQMLDIMKNHFNAVLGRYQGQIAEWIVVNEAIDDNTNGLRSSVWKDRIGDDYIDSAFVYARRADPHALLFYNDYAAEDMGNKSNAVYNLVAGLKARGIPIDGVGWQSHFLPGMYPIGQMDANIKRLAALGLKISITEFDLRIPVPASAASLAQQARDYKTLMQIFLDNRPTCTSFLTWGITDKYSWIPSFFPGYGAALPFDENYQPKAAYDSLLSALGSTTPVVAAPVIIPDGGSFDGSVQVTLSTGTSGAVIRYTTDGSDPTAASTQYTAPFTLTTSATVKAKAYKSGMTESAVTSAVFIKSDPDIPYRINCGGSDAAPFSEDAFFAAGTTYASAANVTTGGVTDPAPAGVYQTERFGNFSYTLAALSAGADYTVRLHFAEIWFDAAGSRVFNVNINSQQVLTNFDIFAEAGAAHQALVKDFQTTANAGGQIIIQFVSVVTNAKCSGIEVLRGSAGVDEGRWSRLPFTDISRIPNPVTRSVLIRILQKDGLRMYDLAGNLVAVDRIQENGVYFLGMDRQTARKIIVIK